ncbi:MAG TPA: tetratricopeptide repeat protein, partial [Rectinema sp.]|nr:tetratricopeptide repeat protein [Rectinema sp.]
MNNYSYDKRLNELSLAEHLFNAEEYEKALGLNLHIGAELNDLRDYDSALQFTERAEICSRKTQNKEKLAESLHQKGLVLQSLSRFREAIDAYEQSLDIKRDIGDKAGEAHTLHQIGMVYKETSRFQEAEQIYKQSLKIRREIGDKAGEAQTLRQIGMVYEETNRFQEASQISNQLLEIKDHRTKGFDKLAKLSFQKDPSGWLRETIASPQKKLAFFVGSGISVDSGLPNFFNFSRNFICRICPPSIKKSDVDEICQRLRPEVLLQTVQQVHKDRTLDFYSSLESNAPNANHFFIALALMAGHCIFTTNVDTLIEQACKKIGFPCNPIVHEDEYEYFLKDQSKGDREIDFKSQLFKLHGSIECDKVGLRKYESIRFVLDRVGLGLTENQEKILSACLQDYDFVFLGYSGNDHFSVLPILRKVDSDQKIYWFKFKPNHIKLEFYEGIEYFRNRKKDLLDRASEGTTYEVKWEDISILDVLSERENSILAIGDSSHIVKKSLEQVLHSDYPKLSEKEFVEPAWVKTVTDFERHILAAMLLIRMRDISNRTEDQLNAAENCAKNEKERAEVARLRASTFSITRRLGNIKSSEEDLIRAISRFELLGDYIPAVEVLLELANLLRISRSFESAKETLDKAEKLLAENKSTFLRENRSYDWPRLMAQLFHYRGLVYGLGQRGTMADKLKAINYCDEAQNFAKQAGDVSRNAAVLNARGLIMYQLAERSGSLLRE